MGYPDASRALRARAAFAGLRSFGNGLPGAKVRRAQGAGGEPVAAIIGIARPVSQNRAPPPIVAAGGFASLSLQFLGMMGSTWIGPRDSARAAE